MLREKQYGAKIDLCLFVNNFIPVINIDEKVAKELFFRNINLQTKVSASR